MKIIQVKAKNIFLSYFILGLLCGGAIVNLLIGGKIDELSTLNHQLTLQLENTSAELAEVKAHLSKSQKLIITKIVPNIKVQRENLTAQEIDNIQLSLKKEVLKLYKPLIGLQVHTIEPSLLPQIIDGRVIAVEQKDFKINVKLIVLSESIYLDLEAK